MTPLKNAALSRRSLLRWLGAGGAVAALPGGVQAAAAASGRTLFYNVRDHGAAGDGATLDTAALQAAIDACAAAGGGTVVFPAGRYLSGTLRLRSRVALWLQAGAVLLGSTRLQDYPPMVPAFRSYTDVNYVERSLLYAERVEEVALCGQGIIDGQGGAKAFQLGGGRENYKQRPYLIRMIEGRRVTVRDVTLLNSPMWVQHYLACDDLVIDGITVHSLVNVNNDGIDLDCCQRVRVANCSITSGDDAIVLKSTAPRPCSAITITNCYLSSRCSALKCGTESSGDFQDITVSNCVIADTRLCAIALEMVDGGVLDGISISNIRIRRTRGAIFMRLGNRARPHLAEGPGGSRGTFTAAPGTPIPPVGKFRNVHISQVTADGGDVTGCAIAGLPGHPLENVTLSGIQLSFEGGGTVEDARREVPEKEIDYPEYKMFGRLPAFGMWCRHVQGLRLHDVQVGTGKPDARPGLVCDDVQQLEVRGWQAASAPAQGEEILLRDVSEAWVHGGRAAAKAAVHLRVAGAKTGAIKVANNWCPAPARAVAVEAEVPAGRVVVEQK
jgi:polygalacturonase